MHCALRYHHRLADGAHGRPTSSSRTTSLVCAHGHQNRPRHPAFTQSRPPHLRAPSQNRTTQENRPQRANTLVSSCPSPPSSLSSSSSPLPFLGGEPLLHCGNARRHALGQLSVVARPYATCPCSLPSCPGMASPRLSCRARTLIRLLPTLLVNDHAQASEPSTKSSPTTTPPVSCSTSPGHLDRVATGQATPRVVDVGPLYEVCPRHGYGTEPLCAPKYVAKASMPYTPSLHNVPTRRDPRCLALAVHPVEYIVCCKGLPLVYPCLPQDVARLHPCLFPRARPSTPQHGHIRDSPRYCSCVAR